MAWYPTLMNNIEPAPEYKTMTILLNLNTSDPTQWAVYDDDAMFMEPGSDAWDEFFGHYPCILEDGVELGKLKRDNFAQYEDGTSAPITTLGKDVMICFPRRGIKLEYLDANTLSVSMTIEDNKEGYSYWAHSYSKSSASLTNAVCDKFYLGAYKGYTRANSLNAVVLYSASGLPPTVNKTINNFRAYAHNHGSGYEQSGFFQLIFRQVMYLLKYKGQNAQIAIGRGFVDYNSSIHSTGGTNTRGMDWGESTGKDQMKLFGLEDFYGNVSEFVDGCVSTNNYQVLVADGNFNNTGSDYIDTGITGIRQYGFTRYPIGTNLGGFINNSATYGSDSTYFCDRSGIDSSRICSNGGAKDNESMAGVFSGGLGTSPSVQSNDYGARLMYMHVAE